jgi:hypothetical protein
MVGRIDGETGRRIKKMYPYTMTTLKGRCTKGLRHGICFWNMYHNMYHTYTMPHGLGHLLGHGLVEGHVAVVDDIVA